MSILELNKDDLLALTDAQLEQLIGRLSEAELKANGADVSDVRFSGSITAPDGGVDVRVDANQNEFSTGFIPRPNTIFQSKKNSMPAGQVLNEMRTQNRLSNVIDSQCEIGGAYIIVSLDDDCTETMHDSRLEAMKTAVEDHPKKDSILLDFYDRFKLHQWLRQHPGVMLWVRSVLARPLSGWLPHGRWSYVPFESPDDLIMTAGVSIILPSHQHQRLTVEEAITPTRNLILLSNKAIRINGLSGVGKTRFVQALFDESVGENALDRTSVVYTDTSNDPDPSARQMVDLLIQSGVEATVVVDNCPPDLHTYLATSVANTKNKVKLITVEYDIRDDKPLTTDVIHMEADGPEIAEALLLRRYPGISQPNANRVAQFSNGNTRIALALADRFAVGESLLQMSDSNLFDRLFQQRHENDGQLRTHAEVLALTYSFSVEGEPDEMEALSSLCGSTPDQLYASVQTILERQIAQRRGRWRAILPQAIANKLAETALNRIRIPTLLGLFEEPSNQRLLMSFGHRLGLMHNHPIAQQIVSRWLDTDGILVPLLNLNEERVKLLEYVAPVVPELLLNRIEIEITDPEFAGFTVHTNHRRTMLLSILLSLAYEPEAFERCIILLMIIASQEESTNGHDSVHDRLNRLFQPYLSGTHATVEQRATIVRAFLRSGDGFRKDVGLKLLSKTLGGPPWMGSGMGEFGARSRDFGYQPNHDQLVSWRKDFLTITLETGLNTDSALSDEARTILAQKFRGLWHQVAMRKKLVEIALELNSQRPWTEGWKAVQETIHYDYKNSTDEEDVEQLPKELAALVEQLEPQDLIANINTYLFGDNHSLWALDPEFESDSDKKYAESENRLSAYVVTLGEQFAKSGKSLGELGPALFSTSYMPFGRAFGFGLVKGSKDLRATWSSLISALEHSELSEFNLSSLAGFIDELSHMEPRIDRDILDQCLDNSLLRPYIRILHPSHDFDEFDLNRCMKALEYTDVNAWPFGDLIWREEFVSLPEQKIIEFVELLLSKPDGDATILESLSMKLHGKDQSDDVLGLELRKIGLDASIRQLESDGHRSAARQEHELASVLTACLSHDGNDAEKSAWLKAIFSSLDSTYGYFPSYMKVVQVTASIMTENFLDNVFSGDEDQKRYRLNFLENSSDRREIFSSTDGNRIIQWCKNNDNPTVWSGVAKAVELFVESADEGNITISDFAVRFLEASSHKEAVLTSYSHRITPSGWSGSRADIMERYTGALESFTKHPDPVIVSTALPILAKARAWIAEERNRERLEDEAQEQKFE